MRLKEFRQKNNLTQEDVARILNKTSVAYSYYESGRNEPDIKTLKILAKYYQTSIDALIGNQTPYFFDLSLLSEEQKEIIEITKNLNYEECRLTLAYMKGLKVGIQERNKKLKIEGET